MHRDERLFALFERYDVDNSGYVDKDEFTMVLKGVFFFLKIFLNLLEQNLVFDSKCVLKLHLKYVC